MLRLFALLATILTLTACETVDGLGQDVSAAGDGLSNTAREVEEEIED